MLVNYTQMYNNINNAVLTSTHNSCFVGYADKIHSFIESLLKHESILQNGYKITFNPAFNEWQTSHPIVGSCESFGSLREAVIYCEKG